VHAQAFVALPQEACPDNVSRETVPAVTTAMEQLQRQCREWGIVLDPFQLVLLSTYADLLATYTLANVIGTNDRETIVLDHLLDSLTCLTAKSMFGECSLVDVGTGAGLPGIPLAIACPQLRVTLLEATEKKVRFLKYARAQLGLANLDILHARAEETGRELRYRDAFDLAVARAVASLAVVVEYCAPLVRPGGHMLAMKGQLGEDELSAGSVAAHELGAQLRKVRQVDYYPHVPQKKRQLVLFNKVGDTPGAFPRRVGLAKRRPLSD
jgi:16S rRNA (guanine527-N7)-methyltransferase